MDGVTVTGIARTFAMTIVTSPATGEKSNMIAGSCVAICVGATMLRLRVSERKSAPAIVTWTETIAMSTVTSGTWTGIATGTVANRKLFQTREERERGQQMLPSCVLTVRALNRSRFIGRFRWPFWAPVK